jgi:hypothetical protein
VVSTRKWAGGANLAVIMVPVAVVTADGAGRGACALVELHHRPFLVAPTGTPSTSRSSCRLGGDVCKRLAMAVALPSPSFRFELRSFDAAVEAVITAVEVAGCVTVIEWNDIVYYKLRVPQHRDSEL